MLEATSLSQQFDYPLFTDLNFSVQAGRTVSIQGVSGSGKSTLLHILSTFLKPNQGEVMIDHQNIYTLHESELMTLRRNRIGLVFQNHYLFRGFTGEENLAISTMLAKTEKDEALLERFGIDQIIKQPISELSGGQQQRLSIARVLMKQPALLFADEPTGNLDRTTAREVMHGMQEQMHRVKGVMVVATHDEEIAQMCDERYILENRLLRFLG